MRNKDNIKKGARSSWKRKARTTDVPKIETPYPIKRKIEVVSTKGKEEKFDKREKKIKNDTIEKQTSTAARMIFSLVDRNEAH